MASKLSNFPLLKKLATQKWHEQAWNQQMYKKIGDEETESSGPSDGRRRIFGTPVRTIVSSLFIGTMAVFCVVGLVWWPSRIHAAQLQHKAEHSYKMADPDPQQLKQSSIVNVQKLHVAHNITEDELRPYHCGSSIKEAQELGCSWDLLSASWLRPECLDRELTDSFRAEEDWPYFADREGKFPLEEKDLQWRVGEGMNYFTTLKYHRTHCSYQWRKMHRAMERGTRIENGLASYHHTLHCGFVFLQDGQLDELLTEISVEFMRC